MKEKTIPVTAQRQFLGDVQDALAECLKKIAECRGAVPDPDIITRLRIVIEEVFVNVACYAFAGSDNTEKVFVTFGYEEETDTIILRFCDEGIPFDPLKKTDPDITLGAAARPIGGLGVFMVKHMMDDVRYTYEGGMNKLILRKKLS